MDGSESPNLAFEVTVTAAAASQAAFTGNAGIGLKKLHS